MSKISNALNMYFLILTRGKLTIPQLSHELELSPRIIKTYRDDLEKAGLFIASTRGRHGGYYIENHPCLRHLPLTTDELTALKMADETIRIGGYHYATTFATLAGKLLAASRDNCHQIHYHNRLAPRHPDIARAEKDLWRELSLAIYKKQQTRLTYKSLRPHAPQVTQRTVNPYGLFDYKGASYFYGYCHTAQDIRFFKLSRILTLELLPDKFEILRTFDFHQVMEKAIGIFNDAPMTVELEIYYPCSEIVRETRISPDQRILSNPDGSVHFTATIKGYTEIKSWILSMGRNVKVLAPETLRRDLEEEVRKMGEQYQEGRAEEAGTGSGR